MSQSLTTYEVDKDERNAYIKNETYNICDIKSEYVLISKNLYQHLMSHYAGSVIKSQFEKKGYNIMADINIETFYEKLDEKEEKLSDKIDSNYDKLEKRLDEHYHLLHDDIHGINMELKDQKSSIDNLDSKFQVIDTKINDKKEMLKAWLPAIFAGICTLIAAFIACFHH